MGKNGLNRYTQFFFYFRSYCLPFLRLSFFYICQTKLQFYFENEAFSFVNSFHNAYLLVCCVQVCEFSFFNDLCYKSSSTILNWVYIILFGQGFWFCELNFAISSFSGPLFFLTRLHTHEALDLTLSIGFCYINLGYPRRECVYFMSFVRNVNEQKY